MLVLAGLAVAIGFLAAHLTRDLGSARRGGPRAPVERLHRAAELPPTPPPAVLPPQQQPPAPAPALPPGTGRLAVVIDDMGADLPAARRFLDLEVAITPAVIPFLPHSLDVAHLARERERPFLVHLPMEPQGYPKVSPGRGALLSSMDEAEVRGGVREALDSLPGAAGINNHMGSRLTEQEKPMGWVMDELKGRGLYFLDSVTSSRSVAGRVARASGVGWARRDVFLDNEQEVEAVGRQLAQAAAKAKRNGSAIAIGHPHRATLEALRLWAPKLKEAGIEVVPLESLVQRPAG